MAVAERARTFLTRLGMGAPLCLLKVRQVSGVSDVECGLVGAKGRGDTG